MANKELFYWNEGTVEDDRKEFFMKRITKMQGQLWEEKWEIDYKGDSPYFVKVIEPSSYW